MDNTRSSRRQPKYTIASLKPDGSSDAQQVERVMTNLLSGSQGGTMSAGNQQDAGPPASAKPTAGLGGAVDELGPTRRVSLDHVFNSTGKATGTRVDSSRDDVHSEVPADRISGDGAGKENVPHVADVSSGAQERSAADASPVVVESVNPDAPSDVAADSPGGDGSFDDFTARFSKILKGSQLTICKVIFDNSLAVGKAEFETTVKDLAEALSLNKRACFELLNKMEAMGFVTRRTIYEGKRLLGVALSIKMNPFQ
jgi:hypothetical protein